MTNKFYGFYPTVKSKGMYNFAVKYGKFSKISKCSRKKLFSKKTPVNYAFSTTGAWSSELLLLVAMIPQELSSIRVAGVSVPNGISC